jgi:hypothetical protein
METDADVAESLAKARSFSKEFGQVDCSDFVSGVKINPRTSIVQGIIDDLNLLGYK